MFSRLPPRATFVADTKFVSGTKNVSDFVQQHFVSAANVSQFAQHKKHHEQGPLVYLGDQQLYVVLIYFLFN